ncbi:hypothetical protein N7522_003752 [Penicillium canescens]|nr:hypothetical protein N7522_003752 [Penicillium canescens]
MPLKCLSRDSYRVGWICPLEVEQIAAMEMLDEEHEAVPQLSGDTNIYNLGSINNHNVVIAGLPRAGNCSAATVVTQMRMTFPNIKYALLVGIGGGVPVKTDHGMIRLGHVVVSEPTGTHSGAIQYDHGKAKASHFERKGSLAPPPTALLNAAREVAVRRQRMDYDPIWMNVERIKTGRRPLRRFKFPGIANDHLYLPGYKHQQEGLSCQDGGCDKNQRIERQVDEDDSCVVVHRGTVASGEMVIKDAQMRDELAQEHGELCFEMEAVGALTDFPCLVIRGISDYCDSHKDDEWHGYAAAVAAAYARQLFFYINPNPTPTTSELPFNISEISEVSQFVARKNELRKMQELLTGTVKRRTAIVRGIEGIGKTQLAIAYIKRHSSDYSAAIWMNAKDETALKQSYARVAEAFDLHNFLPETDHGAIVVTTRSSMVKLGQVIPVNKLENINDSLEILASVSGRDISKQDKAAVNLAKELDGLPLALATAGAYLEQVSVSYTEYLQLYRESWRQLHEATPQLKSYDQKLYSTWNVSYQAYFANEDLWFELLDGGSEKPEWLEELTKNKLTFHGTLRLLCSHELVEADVATISQRVESRGYRVHGCVHSWMINMLNQVVDREMARTAIKCVAACVPKPDQREFWLIQRRLIAHADRCLRMLRDIDVGDEAVGVLHSLGLLYADLGRHEEAGATYERALEGYEQAFGREHASTLNTVNNLGNLYQNQGRLQEAEKAYERALRGYEKAFGPTLVATYIPALNTLENFGLLNVELGRVDDALRFYQRALNGAAAVFGRIAQCVHAYPAEQALCSVTRAESPKDSRPC